MTYIRLFVRYGGKWDNKQIEYEGGLLKGIVVHKEMTYKDLLDELYALTEVNPKKFDMRIKCIYEIKARNQTPPFEISNDRDLNFYLMGKDMSEVPLYISFELKNRGLTEASDVHYQKNKGFKLCYKSVTGSNQVQDLNGNVSMPRHALDDNANLVDFGDKRNETIRWEPYDSCDDNFAQGSYDDQDAKNFNRESYDVSHERNANFDCKALVETSLDHVPKLGCKRKVNYESESANQKTHMNENVWSEGSFTNDKFEVGQIFFRKRDLFMKLSVMAMKRKFEFRVKKSTKEIFYVTCIDENCKWRLRAIKLKDSDIFKISKYVNVHSCSLDINHDHRQAKSWVVGDLIKSKFDGIGHKYKPHEIIEDMRRDYGIDMSYEKAWRARENAYMRVRGPPEESYSLLHRYGETLKLANPGTFYDIELQDGSFFKYLFMALGPCIRGFLNCIRPVIVMDRTCFKSKYRSALIVATSLDGNNQIYPIAFGIVDKETDDSVKWFLEKLKGAIGEVKDLIFVSDQNNSIENSIAAVFPTAFHCLCIHHLKQNLHAKFKNETIDHLFFNAAKAYRESKFKRLWDHIAAFDNGVGRYLEEVGFSRWARMHCPGRRYNMMTTNIAVDYMNVILKEAREFPIASLLEHVRALLQIWFWERRDEASKVTSTLTKWAEEIVHKNQDQSVTMKVNSIDCYQFHVVDVDKEEIVNPNTRECSCKEFQLNQLPCAHAIAVAREHNINVYSLCARYYTTECLLATYADDIFPVGHTLEWKTPSDYVEMKVLPPKVMARVGRRQKKKITSLGEIPKMHKCGRCDQKGHNRLTCHNVVAYIDK